MGEGGNEGVALFDHLRTEPVYNTRAVVQRTGVPADTFRAWERRYGFPVPSRTCGNQRLYSERDIAIISWLRDQTRAGLTISQAVQLFQSEDARSSSSRPGGVGSMARGASRSLSQNPGGEYRGIDQLPVPTLVELLDEARREAPKKRSLKGFCDELVTALVSFDLVTADNVVEEAAALMPVEDVCLFVLQDSLVEIGARWQHGEVGISVEHFASGFVQRKFSALFNVSRPEAGLGPIVAACVEGELHEIGLLLTSLFLSRRGYRIVYLGANLPTCELVSTLHHIRPPLVLLAASTPPAVERLQEAVAEIRRSFRSAPTDSYMPDIGFGGQVFSVSSELRSIEGAHYLGRNAEEVGNFVERLFAPSTAAD